ncbi:hypothetical protein [Amycolatopsis minnesotensis]|uniref:Uncharacterized protein n=1 Tax=Amycolatopsis minnesotensis TaxID=337894 RepID=A0ABN2SYH7_9PSEU
MAIEVRDEVMSTETGLHTALRVERWVVSWLPGRLLDRSEATTALLLADIYDGHPAPGSAWWLVARDYEHALGLDERHRPHPPAGSAGQGKEVSTGGGKRTIGSRNAGHVG